jgi:hypothetical protein
MSQKDYDSAIAEFIRTKGITRCPTVCLAPTQGSVAAADQAALRQRAARFEELRQAKLQADPRHAIRVA